MNKESNKILYKHFYDQLTKLSIQELRNLGETYGEIVFYPDHDNHEQWVLACLSDVPIEILQQKFSIK